MFLFKLIRVQLDFIKFIMIILMNLIKIKCFTFYSKEIYLKLKEKSIAYYSMNK